MCMLGTERHHRLGVKYGKCCKCLWQHVYRCHTILALTSQCTKCRSNADFHVLGNDEGVNLHILEVSHTPVLPYHGLPSGYTSACSRAKPRTA